MNDRKVTRIVTPGTLIDENFMDPFTNNYVLAIHVQESVQEYAQDSITDDCPPVHAQRSNTPVGLAWLDLSTGHFYTQATTLSALPSFLARIGPREIILDEALQALKDHGIFAVLAEDRHLITYCNPLEMKSIKDWSPMLESPIPAKIANDFTPEEEAAGSTLLQYVEARLQGSNMKLQPPTRQLDMMGIDKNTMRALEIKRTIRDDLVTGSLLHVIRRTVTKGGARLLDNWLSMSSSFQILGNR